MARSGEDLQGCPWPAHEGQCVEDRILGEGYRGFRGDDSGLSPKGRFFASGHCGLSAFGGFGIILQFYDFSEEPGGQGHFQ